MSRHGTLKPRNRHPTARTPVGPAIRAVSFDVGGTLIRCHPSVGHLYAEVAAQHGVKECSPEVLNQRFKQAWSRLKGFNHTRAEWAKLVEATFGGLAGALASRAFFEDLYARFAQPDAWHIFEDVVPTLEALASRGLKLGVISNWDARLRPLLRRLKLYDYFDAVVVSWNVGLPKPSRVIFEHAAAKLAVAPEAILHVGDSLEMDVEGGAGAGLKTVLLQREAKRAGAGQVRSLSELLPQPAGGSACPGGRRPGQPPVTGRIS